MPGCVQLSLMASLGRRPGFSVAWRHAGRRHCGGWRNVSGAVPAGAGGDRRGPEMGRLWPWLASVGQLRFGLRGFVRLWMYLGFEVVTMRMESPGLPKAFSAVSVERTAAVQTTLAVLVSCF